MTMPGSNTGVPLMFIDHIVILVPYKTLLDPPAWLTKNFILTPGGRHANGESENKLIIFADGSYIELFAFIDDDPARRLGHWWGDRLPGIVDFALSTNASAADSHAALQDRLQALGSRTGISYAAPAQGGRKRPDGQEIRWEVTFPQGAQRGEVPFFCHDLTSRELRVPAAGEGTAHPCGAYGVSQIDVRVPRAKVVELVKVYTAILGTGDTAVREDEGRFKVGRIHSVEHAAEPKILVRPLEDSPHVSMLAEEGVLLEGLVLAGISTSDAMTIEQLDREEPLGVIMLLLDVPGNLS